jgi:hypothetical protein
MALAAALAMVPLSANAGVTSTDDAGVDVQYHGPRQQVTIPCPATLQCSVTFAPGEILGAWFNADPARWTMHETYSSNRVRGAARPELVVQAQVPGLRTNMLIFSRNTQHAYKLIFESVRGDMPTYVSYRYEDERRAAPKPQPSQPPKPRPAPPPTLLDVMDRACHAMSWGYVADSDRDRKGHVDPVLASIRPAQICGDTGHLYLRMPRADVAVSDLPIVLEDAAAGVTQANARYYERERVFVVNSSANVILRLSIGKRTIDMRVRRVAHG